MNEGLVIIIILAALIIYVIYKRKKAAKLKAEGKTPFGKTYLGCSLPLIIFIIIVFIGMSFFIPFLHESYKNAEIKYGIKEAQESHLKNINKYKNFSNKEAKELSMKLYLLDRCEGGQKTIERLGDYDSHSVYYSCTELSRLNIKKENLPNSKTELENLKYLNTINFGKALEDYRSFINE